MARMRKTKLYNIWMMVRTSFWFIPSLMIIIALGLSLFTVGMDLYVYNHYQYGFGRPEGSLLFSVVYAIGPAGARSVLSTIAGSMITVTGVTFSITIVVLTLASSQFGPRLLRNFMEDRHTQSILGVFSATFLYCLVVLRSVQSASGSGFSPVFSVNFSVVLAVVDVFVLIYFIHHVAVSIKAEHVITGIYSKLEHHIDRIFRSDPEDNGYRSKQISQNESREAPPRDEIHIDAGRNGYLQAVDHDRLLELAVEKDLCVFLHLKAGDFAVATTCLMTAVTSGKVEEDSDLGKRLRDTCIIGSQRTPEQDVEYPIRQLVEVAVRSLSPGINDPFTAASCADYLGAALCLLSQKKIPPTQCRDSDGVVRIVRRAVRFGDIADAAFNQIRQHSRNSPAVTMRLMEVYTAVAAATKNQGHIRELIRHADMLKRSGLDALDEDEDKRDLTERYEAFLKTAGQGGIKS